MCNTKDEIIYNHDTNELTIVFANYGTPDRNRSELFDWLGDYDIIMANELHPDAIIMSGDIYHLTDLDEARLAKEGGVTLRFLSTLDDYIDFEDENEASFYNWYNNN